VVDALSEQLPHQSVKILKANAKIILDTAADLLVFACPTYDHGQPEVGFASFLAANAAADLGGVACAVIGLGSPVYDQEHVGESAYILEKWLVDRGGVLMQPALVITDTPITQLSAITQWAKKFKKTEL
jgi:flavodoxin